MEAETFLDECYSILTIKTARRGAEEREEEKIISQRSAENFHRSEGEQPINPEEIRRLNKNADYHLQILLRKLPALPESINRGSQIESRTEVDGNKRRWTLFSSN